MSGSDIQSVLPEYGITNTQLESFYLSTLRLAVADGITVKYADLSNLSKSRLTGQQPIAFTAYSDGFNVMLHHDLEEVGGLPFRCYDLLHFAFGHFVQWGSDKQSGLRFYDDRAWKLATYNFFGASLSKLKLVWAYEYESHRLTVGRLDDIASDPAVPRPSRAPLIQFFTDWMSADLKFLIRHYQTGDAQGLLDYWERDTNIPPLRSKSLLNPKLRFDPCVPLIHTLIDIDESGGQPD